MRIILLVIPICLLLQAVTDARRAPIRPRVEQPQVYYVDEEDQGGVEEEEPAIVYQPRTRALPSPRSKDTSVSKPPPVQTIRNYNKVNDDGSFTFGYEAADGSFKEETRGTDCVVRGKYGYVDPDGNKREFTYVSGNPCDPNAPKEDDDEPARGQPDDDISGPANYPSVRPVPRPVRPPRPTFAPTTRAPTTVFQSQYQIEDDEEESQELEDIRPTQPTIQRRPQVVSIPRRPQYAAQTPAPPTQAPTPVYQIGAQRYRTQPTQAPTYRTQPTQAPTYRTQPTQAPTYRTSPASASTVYRLVEADTTTPSPQPQTYRPQLSVAITPRPLAAQVAAQYTPHSQTERPGVIYAPAPSSNRAAAGNGNSQLDLASELERYVNTVQSLTPRPARPTRPSNPARLNPAADPIYQSELIFDPATGQYNTQLYQSLPQSVGDFSLSHKLQPFVAQPQQLQRHQQQDHLEPRPSAASIYRERTQPAVSSAPVPQQQQTIFKQQQAQLLQQSQQLYAQQQRRQQQPQPQAHRFQILESQQGSQPFYYISPSQSNQGGNNSPLSVGQIDQFLRGATGSF